MSERVCLGAFTSPAPVSYPPYVNITEELNHSITITVRAPARAVQTNEGVFPIPGAEGIFTMPRRDFLNFLAEVNKQLQRKPS